LEEEEKHEEEDDHFVYPLTNYRLIDEEGRDIWTEAKPEC
jgi:hypothetical protein